MRRFWIICGFAVSALLIVWVFWDVDVAILWSLVTHSSRRLILATVAINFVAIGLKAERWRQILAAAQRVSFGRAAVATLVGFMANNVLPARAGELVRVLVLARTEKLSRSTVLAALALDHLLEGAAFVPLMACLPLLLVTPAWLTRATVVVVAVVVMGFVLLAAVVVLLGGSRQDRWLPARVRVYLAPRVLRFRAGLSALGSPLRSAVVVVLAGASWATQWLMVWLVSRAVGLDVVPAQALFVLIAVNLGTLIPGAPSSVGPFEFAAVVALGYLGVPKTPALSFALLYHFVQVIPTTLAGWAALPLTGMAVTDLGRTRGPVAKDDVAMVPKR